MPTQIPNYGGLGLLAGLSRGLMSGLESYRDERKYQDDKTQKAVENSVKENALIDERAKTATVNNREALEKGLLATGTDDKGGTLFGYDPAFLKRRDDENKAKAAEKFKDIHATALAKEGRTADFDPATGQPIPGTVRDVQKIYHAPVNPAQGQRATNATIRTANTIMGDKNLQLEVKKMSAAHSAQTLIDAIEKGDVKGSSNIANQLTTIMSTIELGGPGAEGDRKAMGVDTLYTRAAKLKSFLDSSPNDSIPPEYLQQLKIEAQALGDRAAQNFHNNAKAAIEGANLAGTDPEADQGLAFRLAEQRRAAALKNNGYDPNTGAPLRAKPGAAPATPAGKVRVSNGKKSFFVDPADVAAATKDGYQVVK